MELLYLIQEAVPTEEQYNKNIVIRKKSNNSDLIAQEQILSSINYNTQHNFKKGSHYL